MIERIPLALTGYLDTAAEPGDAAGTASWRLISSPADCEAQEEVIPCTTSQPDLAYTLLTECKPSDLLRVTGHLPLPDTADGRIRLDVDTVEVLWAAPPEEESTDAPVDDHSDRDRTIQALAEALASLAYEPATAEQPDIRSPTTRPHRSWPACASKPPTTTP
ncbi:hypothetical protein [Streptomyces muensis]|uniref:Uncharacterized protein n=1 Tax=Streptomyces muensis TaxID=1077944 RepID=A0A9X1Q0N7_STRM4|nr:hypothetical protein [Streptomyces muensis]MCF1596857.1 hypothetical protein [Streptomyces muensis]